MLSLTNASFHATNEQAVSFKILKAGQTETLPLDLIVNRVFKSLCDIFGSIIGLTLLIPLLLVFGPLVFVESPGPIIYKQTRTGHQGRLFTIYKIRTMKMDAEADGPQWSKKADPRCLSIGKIMRRWNLDEFPQFWNVLKGEMSLVGPRPERPEFIKDFQEYVQNYNSRHNIKPGITGWAQINGWRGDTDLSERTRHDLFYLEKWSPLLDAYIILKTLI